MSNPHGPAFGGLSLDRSAEPSFEYLAHQAVPLGRGEARRTVDVVRPMVAEAVAKHARGEIVGYDVILQAMPGPPRSGEQEPQWQPMILILVDIAPAAGLAERILNVSNALPPHATAWTTEAVDVIVRTLLDGCFEARAEQFSQATTALGEEQRSPGGLIIP